MSQPSEWAIDVEAGVQPVDNLAGLLALKGLAEYAPALDSLDLAQLKELADKDRLDEQLEMLGMSKPFHRKRVLRAAGKLWKRTPSLGHPPEGVPAPTDATAGLSSLSLSDIATRVKHQLNLPSELDITTTCSRAREILGASPSRAGDSVKDNLREICAYAKIETGWEAEEVNLAELLLTDDRGSADGGGGGGGSSGSNSPMEQHLLRLLQVEVDTWQPNRWRLLKVVGSGSSGKVILCHQTVSGVSGVSGHDSKEPHVVALKFCAASGEESTVKLKREADLMRKIGSHPHICQLLECGWLRRSRHNDSPGAASGLPLPSTGRLLCMCLEYLNGGSLQDVLGASGGGGGMPFAYVVDMATHILDALECLHGLNIIHRDVKPNNIMLTNLNDHNHVPSIGHSGGSQALRSPLDGMTYKLIDFGISVDERPTRDASAASSDSSLSSSSSLVTKSTSSSSSSSNSSSSSSNTGRTSTAGLKAFVGTSHWMSPEQVTAEQIAGHKTDLWSLGAVIYACLCGRKPFAALETDPLRIAVAIKTEQWAPLPDVAAVPEIAAAAVDHAPALPMESWQREAMMDILRCALEKEEEKRFQSASEMKQALLQLATPPFDSGGVRDGLVHKSVSRAHSGAESELSTASTALTNRLAKQKSPGSRPHQGNNVSKPSQAVRFCIDREFVQMEIRAAQEANKNIVTVFESDSRKQAFFDYGEATEKYRGTEWEYLLHIDATTYRRDTFEAQAMIQKILSKSRSTAATVVGDENSSVGTPINSPGKWDFFLSHGQAATGDQVKVLALLLKDAGYTVWYDMDMVDRSTAAMIEGVNNSTNFILFLSGDRGFQDTVQMPSPAISNSTSSGIEETYLPIASEDGGGMLHKSAGSTICMAKDKRLHRTVALKVISAPSSKNDGTAGVFTEAHVAAINRMAIWIGRIQHPHVCACYAHDMSTDKTKFFIALEYIDGVTLETILLQRGGAVREAEAAEWMGMVLEGLSAVHKEQCVHLGVTLSNIMLSKSTGYTKLIDFKLSRRDQGGAQGHTSSSVSEHGGGGASEEASMMSSMMISTVGPEAGLPWGDPYYMSPEAWRGPTAGVDRRADVWSAGCCLFRLVSGYMPFDLDPQRNINFPRDIIGSVLYSMAPAPDVRHRIMDAHEIQRDLPAGAPMQPMSSWQVSDSCAECIAKALQKDPGSRFATAVEMRASLNGVLRTATKYDIFLAFDAANEAAARRLYTLLQQARPVGSSAERLTVFLAETFNAAALKNLSSSSCFVPLISTAVLGKLQHPELHEDAQAHHMLLQCQIAMSLQENGLLSVVPVLYGDIDQQQASMVPLPMNCSFSNLVSRATTAKLQEFKAVAESCPRFARVGGGDFGHLSLSSSSPNTLASISSTISEMLDLKAGIEIWSEMPPAPAHLGDVTQRLYAAEDNCVEKLILNIEAAKRMSAGKLALPSALALTLPSPVLNSLDLLRAQVDYTDVNVKRTVKDLAWFSQHVAIAIAMASPTVASADRSIVERDLARAFVLLWASQLERTQDIHVRCAIEHRFQQQQQGVTKFSASTIEAQGLKPTELALIIDAFTRADLPPEKIESQSTNAREHESWEEFFNVHRHGFYACCMLACHPQSSDTTLERRLREVVVEKFLPMTVRQGYATGVHAMFRAAADSSYQSPADVDLEQLVREESVAPVSRKSAAENEKLVLLLQELRGQLSTHHRRGGDDDDLLSLIVVLTQGEQAVELRSKLNETVLKGSQLARTATKLWAGVTDPNQLRGGKEGARLLTLLSDNSGGEQGWQAFEAASEPLKLALEVISSGGIASSAGAGRDQAVATRLAEQLCVSRKVEFKRFAQIAVPEVAAATGPRFCHGDVYAERAFADRQYLDGNTLPGVDLAPHMHRLWNGERDLDRLCEGADANTRHVVAFILGMVVEHPDSASDSHVKEVLSKIIVELQVTARLALDPPSADRSEGVAMLLSHLDRRNTDLAYLVAPIRRILMENERDIHRLTGGTAALDHVGRAAIKKILDYINHDPVGVLSSSWPTWRALDQPADQTSKIIKNHKVEWKRIAQLAIPDLAKATGPRFCGGGIQAEKDAVTTNLLERLEMSGWMLIEPIQRLWRGERDVVALTVGCDRQDEHIVRHILALVMEHEEKHKAALRSSGGGGNDGGQSAAAAAQSKLEMMDPHRRAQLDKALRLEGRTFMVAAKIAYRIDCAQNTTTTNAAETAQLEADRERLMVHVYGSLERSGLLVGEPIHKILFDGERDADSLTAYTDDIDTVLIERLLSHIQELHRGVSGDLWPSLDDLFAPPEHAARFIRAKRHDFAALAEARGRPDAQRALTLRLLDRWEESGWELRAPTEKMWAGVTDEHSILANSDANSQHVARAIMQAFGLQVSAPGTTTAAVGHRSSVGGGSGPGGDSFDDELIQRLVWLGATRATAQEFLELANGDVEAAANLLLGS